MVVAITDTPISPVGQRVDIVLPAMLSGLSTQHSFVAATAVANAVLNGVIGRLPEAMDHYGQIASLMNEWDVNVLKGEDAPDVTDESSARVSIRRVVADEPDRFRAAREALSGLPMPVVLVGAGRGPERSCATGTAMYVSFAPPRVVVAIHPGSKTCHLMEATGRFSISVLGEEHLALAFDAGRSGQGSDKFADLGVTVVADEAGTPAMTDARLILWCRIISREPVGDHVLFIGEVETYDRSGLDDATAGPALVRQQRRYGSMGLWLSDEAPEGYPT